MGIPPSGNSWGQFCCGGLEARPDGGRNRTQPGPEQIYHQKSRKHRRAAQMGANTPSHTRRAQSTAYHRHIPPGDRHPESRKLQTQGEHLRVRTLRRPSLHNRAKQQPAPKGRHGHPHPKRKNRISPRRVISRHSRQNEKNMRRMSDGRGVSVPALVDGRPLRLASVYAHADAGSRRPEFFKKELHP